MRAITILFIALLVVTTAGAQDPQTAIVRFVGPVNQGSIDRLLQLVDQEIQDGTERIVLLISSPGGSVFYGMTAYNYLKGIPVEVITHNIGSSDSIAIMLLCAGDVRRSVPNGRFVLHGASTSFGPVSRLDEKQLAERLRSLRVDSENIASVIADTIGKDLDEVAQAIFDGTILTPEEAMEWGLITEITSELYSSGARLLSVGARADPESPLDDAPQPPDTRTLGDDPATVSASQEVVIPLSSTFVPVNK